MQVRDWLRVRTLWHGKGWLDDNDTQVCQPMSLQSIVCSGIRRSEFKSTHAISTARCCAWQHRHANPFCWLTVDARLHGCPLPAASAQPLPPRAPPRLAAQEGGGDERQAAAAQALRHAAAAGQEQVDHRGCCRCWGGQGGGCACGWCVVPQLAVIVGKEMGVFTRITVSASLCCGVCSYGKQWQLGAWCLVCCKHLRNFVAARSCGSVNSISIWLCIVPAPSLLPLLRCTLARPSWRKPHSRLDLNQATCYESLP